MAWPDTTYLPDEAFVLPREPTPAVLCVLRMEPWECEPVSLVLQRAGFSNPRLASDVRAHAMAFLLPFAIAFGDEWWKRAQPVLAAMTGPEGKKS